MFGKIYKFAATILSPALIIGGITISLFPEYLPSIEIIELQPETKKSKISVTRREFYPGEPPDFLIPPHQPSISIRVTYPGTIRENQTLGVDAHISCSPGDSVTSQPMPEIEMTLDGAAFKIDPKTRRVNQATCQPQTVRWTALPERTGDHELLLDCSKCLPPKRSANRSQLRIIPDVFSDSLFPFSTTTIPLDKLEVMVNQRPIDAATLTSIQLQVEVVTKWGFREKTSDVFSYVLIFLGFLMALPYFPQIVGFPNCLANRAKGPKEG